MGFPIRKSADQSLFAAPHGLSQRTTSFIASQRQGIHRIPLRHLIALIVDARRDDGLLRSQDFGHRSERPANFMDTFVIAAASMRPRPFRERRLRHLFTIFKQHEPTLKRQLEFLSGTSMSRHPPEGRIRMERKAALVEPDGIEPTTSCLQSRRSPS